MSLPSRPHPLFALLIGVYAGTALSGAQPPASKGFPYAAPLPAVVAFAEKAKLPLERLDIAEAGTAALAGDSVTALVTLYEGGDYRQWLIQLVTAKLTGDEQREIEKAKSKLVLEMFASTGTELRIDGAPYAMETRTIGPFSRDKSGTPAKAFKPVEKHARALVVGGFLGLGLDRFFASAQKLLLAAQQPDGTAKKLDWKIAYKPFPAEVIAKNQALAVAAGITPDDERSIFAGPAALNEFFDIAQKTPGLQDILVELLDKSSLAWSMLTHGGKLKPAFKPDYAKIDLGIDSTPWGQNLPPPHRCPLLISLNEKPALTAELIVTAPRPPLLNCAGVLGLVISPAVETNKRLVIRVLAAKRSDFETPP